MYFKNKSTAAIICGAVAVFLWCDYIADNKICQYFLFYFFRKNVFLCIDNKKVLSYNILIIYFLP